MNYIADDKGFRAYGAHLPWSNLLVETANILESENEISPATHGKDAANQTFSVSNAELGENLQSGTTQKSETFETTTVTSATPDENNVTPEVEPVNDDGLSTVLPDTAAEVAGAELMNSEESDATTTGAPVKQLLVAHVPSITRVLTMSKVTKGPKKMTKKILPKSPSKIIRFRLTYNPTFQSHTLTRILE